MIEPDSRTVVLHARSGRRLTVAVAVLCAASFVAVLLEDPAAALRYGLLLVLPAVLVWAVYERPAVVVSDAGVEVRNVLRTIDLPWPAIERIDTKYALTLHTAFGTYSAWAAPAPSRSTTVTSSRDDLRHLPESTYIGGGVRPGDLLSSASGQAAAVVRARWEELRDAGHLDAPRLERDRPVVRWHVVPAAGVLLLAAAGVAAVRVL
ncbi:PH domain-containing protein [Actinotalea sp. AC32]|nr:PH domain-containing protein [Actinotalea sp. AC32]